MSKHLKVKGFIFTGSINCISFAYIQITKFHQLTPTSHGYITLEIIMSLPCTKLPTFLGRGGKYGSQPLDDL